MTSSYILILGYFQIWTILTVVLMTHVSETFGPEHRPIIEFAIENSQKLKLRARREALAKGRQARTAKDGFEKQGDGSNSKAKKWESKNGEELSVKDTRRSANDSSEAHDGDQPGKRKRENKNKNKKKADQKMEVVTSQVGTDTISKGSAVEGKKPNKKRQKLQEGNPVKQDSNKSKKISSEQTKSSKPTPDKFQGVHKARVTPQVFTKPSSVVLLTCFSLDFEVMKF